MQTYWRFYWPLALTGVGMVLSVQFQNATLARYPEAVTELAVVALAHGVFGFFNACLQFISQLTNVYARSPAATRRTWHFVVLACFIIMAPLLLIATTESGHRLVQLVFGIDAILSQQVSVYLMLMCPLVLLNGQRHYLTGLMIQAHRTGWVTACNFVYLGTVIAVLVVGFTWGWAAPYVIVGAELLGVSVLIGILLFARYRAYQPPDKAEHEDVTFAELTKFFIPVSTTGVMFALSRPVLFAFVSRTPNGLLAIAALRVAFDFSMLFQQAANQFRHFFISFGFDDIEKKRRFMTLVAVGITAIMLAFALTPLSNWVWGTLMGVPAELMALSVEVLIVMCLMPGVIIYRNYFHSRLMQLRRTAGMAYGGMLRVLGILIAAAIAFQFNALNHLSAATILILGFVIEAMIARRANSRASSVPSP